MPMTKRSGEHPDKCIRCGLCEERCPISPIETHSGGGVGCPENLRFIQGNEAVVEGAILLGSAFMQDIPSRLVRNCRNCLPSASRKKGGTWYLFQMEDENASMCSIIGASLTGRKVMTATSGPGFSLMQEAIGLRGHG